MNSKSILPLFVLLAVITLPRPVHGGADAEALFHPAARDYIVGLIDEAEKKVDDALRQFPDDRRLLRLKELIEQQRQQEQQPDSQPDPADPSPSDSAEPHEPSEPEDPEGAPDEVSPPEPSEQMAEPEEATSWDKEEALRILDAMRQNEQDQRRDLRPVLGPPERVEKDW